MLISSCSNRAIGRRAALFLLLTTSVIMVGCSLAEDVARTTSDERAEGTADGVEIDVPTVPSSWGQPATVLRIIDGDSLELEVEGQATEVRLPGFNAPELFGDNGQTCQGLQAKQALEAVVESGNVRFEPESQDRFGRTLGQVSVDGRLIIDELIGQGWGLATSDSPSQRNLMKAAAEGERGIWGEGCGQAEPNKLSIGDTHVDAEGNDRSNLNDEWVEITNSGSERIDISQWIIRDETFGHRFALQGGLESGASLRIRTGNGTDSAAEMFLGERFPVWSNSGETVVLVDPNGVFVDWTFID